MTSRAYQYSRNSFAVIGLVSMLGAGLFFGVSSFFEGFEKKTILKMVANADSSAKATLYQVDAGATAATRTSVALSNPGVDGSRRGDVVLTLIQLQGDASQITLEWKTSRHLVVTYPANGDLEYSVSKIRGITIEAEAH